LILWLTGGPGCASEIALFYENGPYKVNGHELTGNPESWNNFANLLYVD
jgi:serine carboxypeptidase-like clade 4